MSIESAKNLHRSVKELKRVQTELPARARAFIGYDSIDLNGYLLKGYESLNAESVRYIAKAIESMRQEVVAKAVELVESDFQIELDAVEAEVVQLRKGA